MNCGDVEDSEERDCGPYGDRRIFHRRKPYFRPFGQKRTSRLGDRATFSGNFLTPRGRLYYKASRAMSG
jgi:hypothetical protein